jgi:hypothetical protein
MADRSHRYQNSLQHRWGHVHLSRQFIATYGDAVLRGPCEGLRYPAERILSLPKRLGAYETEIAPWVSAGIAARPTRFVDIGTADGYYAVGFARHGIPVEAFELSRTARWEIEELAALNGTRVTIHKKATARRLLGLDLDGAFVLSDCEGAEVGVLTPEVVERMRTATVVIEVHDQLAPGAEATMRERFAGTHHVDRVDPEERDPARLPGDRDVRAGAPRRLHHRGQDAPYALAAVHTPLTRAPAGRASRGASRPVEPGPWRGSRRSSGPSRGRWSSTSCRPCAGWRRRCPTARRGPCR